MVALGAVIVVTAVSCKRADPTVEVTSVSVNPAAKELVVGETTTITATVLPENATDKTVTWISSSYLIASVEDGVVIAVGEGQALIRAEAGGKEAYCVVNVKKFVVNVTGIYVINELVNLYVGDTRQVEYTIEPENATIQNVSFSSDNADVAAVDNDGFITALSEGTARITVTTQDGGFTSDCIVTVAPIPEFPDQTYVDGLYYKPATFNYYKVWVTQTPDGKEKYSGDIVVPTTITYDGIEYSVYGIGDRAFEECENLKSVTLEEGITDIDAWAFFFDSNLEKLSLPASFDYITDGNPIFTTCRELEIAVNESNPNWYVKDGMLFMNKPYDSNTLWWLFEKTTGTVTIPDGIEVIGDYSICNTNIDKLVIPASVNTIETRFFNSCYGYSCKLPLEIELNWTTQEQVDAITTYESNPENFYFRDTDRSQVTISVPKGTKSLYENHWLWGTMGKIVER